MRVFGEKPWAVLGANPQIPASIFNSVPLTRTHTPFKEHLDEKTKPPKPTNLLTTALQIHTSPGWPTVGGGRGGECGVCQASPLVGEGQRDDCSEAVFR